MRSFYVLVIDDDIFDTVTAALHLGKQERVSHANSEALVLGNEYNWESLPDWNLLRLGFVDELENMTLDKELEEVELKVFFSKSVCPDEVWVLHINERLPFKLEGACANFLHILRSADVIVLDMRGIGSVDASDDQLFEKIASNFRRIDSKPPEFKGGLGSKHCETIEDGVRCFHWHLQDIKICASVVVLTALDNAGNDYSDSFLHPFTLADADVVPYTVKFGKVDEESSDRLADIVATQLEFARSGLTDATNRRQIAFAACHDLPVMIIGESGAGKERIAEAIHRLWTRKKLRKLRGTKFFDRIGRMQVVHCGGLNEALARGELFGVVKGAFTDANQNRLGAIPIACGVVRLKDGSKASRADDSHGAKWKRALDDINSILNIGTNGPGNADIDPWDVFKVQLVPVLNSLFRDDRDGKRVPLLEALQDAKRQIETAMSGGQNAREYKDLLLQTRILEEEKDKSGSHLDLRSAVSEAIGTLFLDEFGDLPLDTQTLLLRFLQSGEIAPVGYPGSIRGLKARVIVATSDARVAAFAGYNLGNDFRTEYERSRPLRHDLLYRVKGQVIRVEPISESNVTDALRSMIADKSNPHIEWDADGIHFVAKEVSEILKNGKTPFGQRRELMGFVTLVWEYARNATEMGIRDLGVKYNDQTNSFIVSPDVIRKLWKPGMLHMDATLQEDSQDQKEQNFQSEVDSIRKELETLFEDKGKPLSGDWQWKKEVLDNLAVLVDENDRRFQEELSAFLKGLEDKFKGREHVIAFALKGKNFSGNKYNEFASYKSDVTMGRVLKRKNRGPKSSA